jgi:hypothetical protein
LSRRQASLNPARKVEMMRSVLGITALVLALPAPALASGEEGPASPVVSVIVVGTALPSLEPATARACDILHLERAFQTYFRDIPHGFAQTSHLPSSPGFLAHVGALAAEHNATFVAWWSCQESEHSLAFSAAAARPSSTGIAATQPAVLEASYRKPADASFYRLAALKLRSALRMAMLSAALQAPPAEPADTGAASPSLAGPAAPIPTADVPKAGLAATAAASGRIAPGSAVPRLALRASLGIASGRWTVSAVGDQSLPLERNVAAGSASLGLTRLGVELKLRFADRIAPRRVFFGASLETGVDWIHARARLAQSDPDERALSRVVPVISPGLLVGWAPRPHWKIFVAAGVDLFFQNTQLLLLGDEVYASGWAQPTLRLGLGIGS